MKKTYTDSAIAPIIAFDFDGTVNINGESTYPQCGEVRRYAREVMNLLHNIGCKVIIWTSRDVAYNQEDAKIYDHLTPMIEFLDTNNIKYDGINKSIQFAPYAYNGRKVYAHMYIDDRAFGWYENRNVMLMVLKYILVGMLGIPDTKFSDVWSLMYDYCEIPEEVLDEFREYVKHWKD